MKLEDINRIKQSIDEQEVNRFLSEGYKIIKILSTKQFSDGNETVQPMYVLGLIK
jgi:hypothetical protein